MVDGDFAMLESEVQNVLKALRGAGINVVAIHQHMAGEEPRIIFLHYWGLGSIETLARGCALLSTRRQDPTGSTDAPLGRALKMFGRRPRHHM